MYKNRQDCWEQFWETKIMVGGEVDLEQVKQELFHHKTVMDQQKESGNSMRRTRILCKRPKIRFGTKTRKRKKEVV
ncbi:hypothetical protein ACQKFK_30655 [Bacillus mycoides]|uniref:hypothetical protein n=1 Tax=Bacillus mycoides TaxID=1405 RepID=UPI003D0575C5